MPQCIELGAVGLETVLLSLMPHPRNDIGNRRLLRHMSF